MSKVFLTFYPSVTSNTHRQYHRDAGTESRTQIQTYDFDTALRVRDWGSRRGEEQSRRGVVPGPEGIDAGLAGRQETEARENGNGTAAFAAASE
jgi:hypothetical protein